jgi:hypothetical protein
MLAVPWFYRGVELLSASALCVLLALAIPRPAGAEQVGPTHWTLAPSPVRTPIAHRPATLTPPAALPGANASAAATATRGTLSFSALPATGPVGVQGQVNVGKSHVYVPYYGGASGGLGGAMQSVAGLGIGFGSWNVSVVDRMLGTDLPNFLQSAKAPNPALTLSIRF